MKQFGFVVVDIRISQQNQRRRGKYEKMGLWLHIAPFVRLVHFL
jgi:hypothetical protein